MTLSSSTISGAVTEYGAIHINLEDYTAKVVIIKCNFEKNQGIGGDSGAISFENAIESNVQILDSIFQNNSAISVITNPLGGFGGALIFSNIIIDNPMSIPVYNISGCTFKNNFASRFGGAIYSYNTPPTFSGANTFEGNTIIDSQIANNFATQPVKLSIVDRDTIFDQKSVPTLDYNASLMLSLIEIGPNIPLLGNEVIALLDLYNQVVLDDEGTLLYINTSGSSMTANDKYSSTNGIFDIQASKWNSTIGTTTTINLSTNAIPDFRNLEMIGNTDPSQV